MKKNILITGASGMVGKGALLECLDSNEVGCVGMVNRRALDISHEKLSEILLPDFLKPEEIKEKLKGYDALLFCAGVSSVGMSEEEYHTLTYDLTVGFARTFLEVNKDSTIIYVSGTGTDSTEKGRSMWARVKGKTENALLEMGYSQAYMFRPGYIQPMKGIKSRTKLYQTIYTLFRPIYYLLKLFPNGATSTTKLGQAMIRCVVHEENIRFLENREINALAKKA